MRMLRCADERTALSEIFMKSLSVLVLLAVGSGCGKKAPPGVDSAPIQVVDAVSPQAEVAPDVAVVSTVDAAVGASVDAAVGASVDAATGASVDAAAGASVGADVGASVGADVEAGARVDAVASVDVGAAPEGQGASKLGPRPAKGLIEETSLDLLWGEVSPDASVVPNQAFELAKRCLADRAAEGCSLPSGIIAVNADRVAVRIPDDMGGCGEGEEAWGWMATAADPRPSTRTRLFVSGGGDVDDDTTPTWRWVMGLVEAGFSPSQPLIIARVELPSGIRAHTPTAVLSAPLANWFLDARADDKGDSTLALVSPDNQTRHVLGVVAMKKNKACKGADRTDGVCRDFTDTSLIDVALSADKLTLFVLGNQGDGSHCGSSMTFFRAYPLPKAVALTF